MLLLVEADDNPVILGDFEMLKRALEKHRKPSRIIRYTRGGGHLLFSTVDYYWSDLRDFLKKAMR